ncbi:Candidapepsin-9, partial [Candida parapsilosis]
MRVLNNMCFAAILILWLPLVSSKTKNVSPTSFKVNFNVRRGSARDLLSPSEDSKPKFVKRDNDGSSEMELVNEKTFYLANLYIGSNEDKNQVLVDTGSSDLWVMSHDLECYGYGYRKKKRDAKNVVSFGNGPKFIEENEVNDRPTKSRNTNKVPVNKAEGSAYNSFTYLTDSPEASEDPEPSYDTYSYYSYESYYGGSNTCTSYGTFNTENSDSFVQNDTDPFMISYADNSFAIGIWGHDTVRIGDLLVEDLSFAVANESSSDVGVLGIGLPGLEVTNDASGYTYE